MISCIRNTVSCTFTVLSGIFAVSVKCFVLFSAFVIFTSVSPAYAEKNPYKSKTADECVEEKECVWHHLALAIQADATQHKVTSNVNVKKWEKPIRVRLTQSFGPITEEAVENHLTQIAPFVTQPISGNKKYNYLIVVTDDIEKELSGEFDQTFKDFFGKNLPLEAYKKVKSYDKKCHYLHLQYLEHNLSIHTYFAFIQKDHADLAACLKEVTYAGFGLSDISWTPLLATDKSEKYAKLELLLNLILYQDYIRTGMTLEQVRKVFDKIYEPALSFAKQIEGFK